MAGVWDSLRGRVGGAVAHGARRVAETVENRLSPAVVDLGGGAGLGRASVQVARPQDNKPAGRVKALFDDPMTLMGAFGYKDRPASISYNMMRDVLYRLPIVSNIIQLRVEQVAAFGHVAADRYAMGFRVKMRENADVPSGVEKELCRKFERFFLRTGFGDDWRGRDGFEAYLRKITRDALTFDQNCTELVPGNNGAPCEFYAVDASNMRIARHLRRHTAEQMEDSTAYVELYNETIRTRFTADEMIFGIRNPSTDIRLQGYGTSEIEYLMPTLTQMIYALDYNGAMFTKGTMAKGILNIRDPDLTDQDLNQIQRHWQNACTGIANAGAFPVIAASNGAEWIALQGASDQQYSSWIDFLIKVTCAAYKVSPEEISLNYGQIGQSSAMSEQNNRDKITESKQRGLRPLLRHIEGNINRHIMWPNHPDLEFEFVGLDAMTPEERSDYNAKRLRSLNTLNEIRAEDDLKPLPGGDIVLDGTYLQSRMQEMQSQQQQVPQPYGDDATASSDGAPPRDDQAATDQPAEQEPPRQMLGITDIMRSEGAAVRKATPATRRVLDVTL